MAAHTRVPPSLRVAWGIMDHWVDVTDDVWDLTVWPHGFELRVAGPLPPWVGPPVHGWLQVIDRERGDVHWGRITAAPRVHVRYDLEERAAGIDRPIDAHYTLTATRTASRPAWSLTP